MDVTINKIPPKPVEPIVSVTLVLSSVEAEVLRVVAGYPDTVSRALPPTRHHFPPTKKFITEGDITSVLGELYQKLKSVSE